MVIKRILVALLQVSFITSSRAAFCQEQDVVSALLPDGNVGRFRMPAPAEKERVIQRLKKLQPSAPGRASPASGIPARGSRRGL